MGPEEGTFSLILRANVEFQVRFLEDLFRDFSKIRQVLNLIRKQ